jgi:hypothetical protein
VRFKQALAILQGAAKEVDESLCVDRMHDEWPHGRNAELDVQIDLGQGSGCRIVWIKEGVLQQEKMGRGEFGYDYFDLSSQDDIDKWKKTLPKLIRINELVQRTKAINNKHEDMPEWLKKKARRRNGRTK